MRPTREDDGSEKAVQLSKVTDVDKQAVLENALEATNQNNNIHAAKLKMAALMSVHTKTERIPLLFRPKICKQKPLSSNFGLTEFN